MNKRDWWVAFIAISANAAHLRVDWVCLFCDGHTSKKALEMDNLRLQNSLILTPVPLRLCGRYCRKDARLIHRE